MMLPLSSSSKLLLVMTLLLVTLLLWTPEEAEAKGVRIGGGWRMASSNRGRKPWERTRNERWRYWKDRWESRYEPWEPVYAEPFNYGAGSNLPKPCVGICYHMKLMALKAISKTQKRLTVPHMPFL